MEAEPGYYSLRLANALCVSFGDWLTLGLLFGVLRVQWPTLRRVLLGAAVVHGAVSLWGLVPLRVLVLELAHDGHATWYGVAAWVDLGLASAWLATVVVLGAVRTARLWRLHRLLRCVESLGLPGSPRLAQRLTAMSVRMGVAKPRLLELDGYESPFVLGFRRPVLVFPTGLADALTDAELDAVLAHELTHVRRGDLWVAAILEVIRTLHFFNLPLLALIRRYELEVEKLRDQESCRIVGGRRPLASSLYKVLVRGGEPAPCACVGVAPLVSTSPRHLTLRLRSLRGRRTGAVWAAAQVLLVVGLAPWPYAWTGDNVTVRRVSREAIAAKGSEHSRVSGTVSLSINPLTRKLHESVR